jgi:DNA-binding response OmpR family regulator
MTPNRKKLLIVEDDNMLRDILSDQLSREYEIAKAEDGEQGLKFAKEFKPDLIILDLMLPKLGGLDLLEMLRKNTDPEIANVKVIILSNMFDKSFIGRAQNLSVATYLVKGNTDVKDITGKIHEALK